MTVVGLMGSGPMTHDLSFWVLRQEIADFGSFAPSAYFAPFPILVRPMDGVQDQSKSIDCDAE